MNFSSEVAKTLRALPALLDELEPPPPGCEIGPPLPLEQVVRLEKMHDVLSDFETRECARDLVGKERWDPEDRAAQLNGIPLAPRAHSQKKARSWKQGCKPLLWLVTSLNRFFVERGERDGKLTVEECRLNSRDLADARCALRELLSLLPTPESHASSPRKMEKRPRRARRILADDAENGGHYTAKDAAQRLGLSSQYDAVRRRMERWRNANQSSRDYIEDPKAPGRMARFTYKLRRVREVCADLLGRKRKRP